MEELTIDPNTQSVGKMVADDYRKAEVFKKFGIDFCCGGKKTIHDVCNEKGIDEKRLMSSLGAIEETSVGKELDFNILELDKLCQYIVNTHHVYVLESIALLEEFGAKVARVHGEATPEVVEIYHHFKAVRDELQMHMHKEEAILFPYVEQLAVAKRYNQTVDTPPFGTIVNPINMMENEHEFAGDALKEMRRLSNDFTPPAHACNTFRVFYAKLDEFENDLHKHVHLENNVLFPRAIAMEKEITN